MRALQFDISVPRYALGKSVGKLTDWAVFGRPSGLSLRELPDPALPGPEWTRLEVLSCGICGTDLGTFTFRTSPALEPFSSFPAVPGHEILARVVEVGAAVTRVKVGDRVAVEPSVGCVVRGRSPAERCPSCAAGLPGTCTRGGDESQLPAGRRLARGFFLGSHRDLPGGFGEQLVAHQAQLFVVPEGLDDVTAGLTEPLSIGMHAALQVRPDPAAPVLVIGSGVIALGTVWALRATGHHGPIVSQTRRAHEAALARELGASSTVTPGDAARGALLATGATAYRPIIGPEVYAGGGFPFVFDCVGTRESLDQALRFVSPRGRVVLLGCASVLDGLDLTFVWSRELTVQGFLTYGRESWHGESCHTYEVTHRLMRERPAPLARLVTHTFPLAQYREALSAAAHHRTSGAIKVRLVPKAS